MNYKVEKIDNKITITYENGMKMVPIHDSVRIPSFVQVGDHYEIRNVFASPPILFQKELEEYYSSIEEYSEEILLLNEVMKKWLRFKKDDKNVE